MSNTTKIEDKEHVYARSDVVNIINSVLSKVEHSGDDQLKALHNEIKSLSDVIDRMRSDIATTRPADIAAEHIPSATDELDAVVEATADATGAIMDCCEVIEAKAANAGDAGAEIAAEVTKIYEACSFQDITGQRISKVVKTLKEIEEKIDNLMHVLAGEALPEGAADKKELSEAEQLLNGPQMKDKAISQDDIDKLLDDF